MPIVTKSVGYLKGIKVIHLLYDLYPDAMEVAGKLKREDFLVKTIGKIIALTQQKTDATVYLGAFLKTHAEGRWGRNRKSSVIHISTDLSLYTQRFNKEMSNGRLIIHYGGQMGYLHDADYVIACVKRVLQSEIARDVEFNFYISGAQAQYLKQSFDGLPVTIKSSVPSSEWRDDIASFHIGLVSLTPGGATVCLPSKTYGMMAGGMAIIGLCPSWSDLSSLILESNSGWVVNNSVIDKVEEYDIEDFSMLYDHLDLEVVSNNFLHTIEKILKCKEDLIEKRENAYSSVRSLYNQSELSKKWFDIIEKLD